jgi:hypothetical protein
MLDGVDCRWLTPVRAFLDGRKAGVSSFERTASEVGPRTASRFAFSHSAEAHEAAPAPHTAVALNEQELGLGSSKRDLL